MLANQLTLDEEDAVQEELRALEAVSATPYRGQVKIFTRHFQAQMPSPEVQLPSPPTTEPVSSSEVLNPKIASQTSVDRVEQPPHRIRVPLPA
jgi:hypothetical protein